MPDSVFNFDQTEFPALYRKVSDKVEQSGVIDIERVPEVIHFNAIQNWLEDSNVPVRSLGKKVYSMPAEQAEIFIDDIDFEKSAREIAIEYRKIAHNEDWKFTGRDHHDRTVDAQIENAIENPVTRNYDVVLRETFFQNRGNHEEGDYEDITIPTQTFNEVASDADFCQVDLSDQEIELVEVKTQKNKPDNPNNREEPNREREIDSYFAEGQNTDQYWDVEEEPAINEEQIDRILEEGIESVDLNDEIFEPEDDDSRETKGEYAFKPDIGETAFDEMSRAEKQKQIFKEAIEYANEVVGTDFTVEAKTVYATNIIYTENIVPNVWKGDIHQSEDIDDKKVSELESFMDEFLYGMSFQDAEKLQRADPEEYNSSQSV